MGAAITDFLEELSRRGHEPQLEATTGTIRFELVKDGNQSERWFVSIDKGDVDVSHRSGKADCTVRGPEKLLDGMASGEVNPLAAVLRGEVFVDGDTRILVRFQGLFPGPPRKAARKSRKAGGGRKR